MVQSRNFEEGTDAWHGSKKNELENFVENSVSNAAQPLLLVAPLQVMSSFSKVLSDLGSLTDDASDSGDSGVEKVIAISHRLYQPLKLQPPTACVRNTLLKSIVEWKGGRYQ